MNPESGLLPCPTAMSMSVRVAQLMSRGVVQTLSAAASLDEIAGRLRRIGHSCWPVQADGQVVGLLHQRDLERALEHGLGGLCVRDIMQTGMISVHEDEGLPALEATLAPHGRSCVAVVDEAGQLLGVVSRGDLLRHRAKASSKGRELSLSELPQAGLFLRIAAEARRAGLSLWLVGGPVRDLLLGRPCDDIDFLVEDSPRRFARQLCKQLGGRLNPPTPFGTQRWVLDEQVARHVDIQPGQLPSHVDFAAARAETYARPAALPEVYRSTLRQDLGRRDFSINALAVQVAPEPGPVIDQHDGLADLDAGLIRVLHSLSFQDDPLRIVRAWRFSVRFGFTIETRTAELMQVARPALGSITGTRLRNELELLLQEDDPGSALLAMQDAGLLQAIHPAFRVPADIAERLRRVQDSQGPPAPPPRLACQWHVLASSITPALLTGFCERMLFPPKMTRSLLCASALPGETDTLAKPDASTLQIVERLRSVPPDAAWCVWRLTDDPLVRERMADYLTRWPETRALSSGHDLHAAGLAPGPAFRRILLKLRVAWYDREISSAEEESNLLQQLVAAELQVDEEEDAAESG